MKDIEIFADAYTDHRDLMDELYAEEDAAGAAAEWEDELAAGYDSEEHHQDYPF